MPFHQIVIKGENVGLNRSVFFRIILCAAVVLVAITGFYASLIFSSASLKTTEKSQIRTAIEILDQKGFSSEVFLLSNLTSFRSNDNWLNASVEKENAYAATNFPFEIMTIYPEFFQYTTDDTERAAILLHEAKHLEGKGEKEAYEFVWRNRKRLGWTKEHYGNSKIWQAVKKQTKEYSPNLFICTDGELGDCTDF